MQSVRNLEKSKFIEDIARDEKLSLQLLQLDVNSDGNWFPETGTGLSPSQKQET
jgi:hypothetical protein